jgi:hypothetical protein
LAASVSSTVSVAASSTVVVVSSAIMVASVRVWLRCFAAISSFCWNLRHGEFECERGERLLLSLRVQRL